MYTIRLPMTWGVQIYAYYHRLSVMIFELFSRWSEGQKSKVDNMPSYVYHSNPHALGSSNICILSWVVGDDF